MGTIESLRGEARIALAAGDYQRALSLLQPAIQRYPNDHDTTALVGQIHLENGKYADARDAFDGVLEVDPENVMARSALAIIAEEEGELEEALEQFERAFEMNTSNHQVAEEIKRLRSRLGDRRPVGPDFSRHAVARRHLRGKEHGKALPLFQGALEDNPGDAAVLVGLSQALWLSGALQDAEETARRILEDHPNCLKALAILAGAAFARGDGEATALLARASELNPGNRVARKLFEGAGYPFPGGRDGADLPLPEAGTAIAPAEAALPPHPDSPSSPGEDADAGERATDRTDKPRSMIGLEESVRQGGKASPLRLDQQTVERIEGPLAGRLASALSDDVPECLGLAAEPAQAQISHETAPPEQGEGTSTGLQVSTPRRGDADLHIAFARSFEARGHLEFALSEYRKALRLDDSTAPAILEAAQAMLDRHPENLEARWLVGDALAIQGQFRQAVQQYTKVLRSRPAVSAGGLG